MRALAFDASHPQSSNARIGGGALIGGVTDWPRGPLGHPLVLVASLPAAFLAEHAGIAIGAGRIASVFSTYLPGEYFLDHITYHGDATELALLRQGTTQVLVHAPGTLVQGGAELPAHGIRVRQGGMAQSLIGDRAQWLQAEDLALDGLAFALQIYGGDLPAPLRNLFYLADSVGYLYLPTQTSPGTDRNGLFFVQAT